MWLLHPEFKEKFRDWWQECTVEGWEGHKFMRKLKFVKSKLKEWNIVAFGDLRERKKLILSNLGRGSMETKSRVKWIKEGDCNSKFFHRMATGRRSESWRVEGIDWVPISGESAVWLDKPFSVEEVRMAVFQLNKEKAQVLLGRLRKVLHETISGSQGAFVEGRHILDAVLIANEVVDEKKDHVLQRKGFSQKWRSWIRGCLSSSSFAILVNGNAKVGLRPLERKLGLTEGFFVGRDRTRVSLLQFADDTIFSLKPLWNIFKTSRLSF
ncbi:hypothetical protein CK203_062410 [Vitis vinifera]|uniref:Reverse transcriptase domain-containing protein n=1 Tax=Vitis vinifera TaxID=29760 RepID=A0A438FQ01_VITVI|nr:hypothetical protein CK203_062410 [Vitis vinifera]